MEETSGRVAEISISQDRQTCSRCCMYRTEQQQATQPPLHSSNLEEGRQHKLVSSEKGKQSEEASDLKELQI